MRSTLKDAREIQDDADQEVSQEACQALDPSRRRTVERHICNKTGGWLTAAVSTANQTDIAPQVFRDALHLRYGKTPDLPATCDGCGSPFTVQHALNCKKGGLVIRRHDEVRDVIGDLCSAAWGNNAVKREVVLREEEPGGAPGVRTDLVVRGVWEPQVRASFDLCIINADAPCYRNANRSTASVLKQHETQKKAHHRQVTEDARMHFTPLAVTVDGVWGREALHFLKCLSSALVEKDGWRGRSYSHIMGWVRARLSTALVRATGQCLRGSRVPWRSLGCEDAAGTWAHGLL